MNPNPSQGQTKAHIRTLLKALKELNGATSLDENIATNQHWVTRLAMLQTNPQAAYPVDMMFLIGSPIAAWPTIQSEAGRERRERTDLLYKLSTIRTQTADKQVALTLLNNELNEWLAFRARQFPHVSKRIPPPQERTPWPVPPPQCKESHIYHYDLLKPQIQQYEAEILGGFGRQGPADGVAVTLAPALQLPPNVRDALKYVGVFKSWTTAFGTKFDDQTQPALDQAINLAMGIGDPSSLFVSGSTPIYVLDGANIFNRSQARWDASNRCGGTFTNEGAGRPGPVIIVMQHHHFVEDILSTKSGVRTDENLKQLDFFLCQLHAGYFPVVILEMQPEKCQDTAWLPEGQSGEFEFPCLYNDRSKEWPKRADGTEDNTQAPVQKRRSACRVWEEAEDKEHAGKKLWHVFCEFDDAIVDQLVERAVWMHGVQRTFRVSNDGNTTDPQKRTNIWKEMVRLGDRLRVRLYTLEQRIPTPLESSR